MQAILTGASDDFSIGMQVELDLETLRQDADGNDVVIYRFRPSRGQRMRFDDAAIAGVGQIVRFGLLQRTCRRSSWRARRGCWRSTTPA